MTAQRKAPAGGCLRWRASIPKVVRDQGIKLGEWCRPHMHLAIEDPCGRGGGSYPFRLSVFLLDPCGMPKRANTCLKVRQVGDPD